MLRKTLLLTLLIALLTACAPQTTPTVAPVAPTVAATEAPATAAPTEIPAKRYTDGLGREITLETTPQRIVSLAPSNTEILFAIGAG